MDWDSLLERLAEEAEQNITSPPRRTWGQFAAGLPVAPVTRQKSPERSVADARQSYVLDRLGREVENHPYHEFVNAAPGFAKALRAYEGKDPSLGQLSKKNLESPREWSVVGPGSAFHNAGTWLQSSAGAALAVADLAANLGNDAAVLAKTGTLDHPARKPGHRGYGEAARDLGYHYKTFVDGTPIGQIGPPDRTPYDGPPRSAWEDMRQREDHANKAVNWRDFTGFDRYLGDQVRDPGMPEMRPWMREHRVQDIIGEPATAAIGFVGDNLLNLSPMNVRAMSNFSRTGQMGKAAKLALWELLPQGLLETAANAPSFLPEQKVNPLDQEAAVREVDDLRRLMRGRQ